MVNILFGPKLYKIYRLHQNGSKTLIHNYEANSWESIGETIITTISYALSVSYYFSPILAYNIYTKNSLKDSSHLTYYIKVCVALCCTLGGAYMMRWCGRLSNKEYINFIKILKKATKDRNERAALQAYDFEFKSWPVDFSWKESNLSLTSNLNPYQGEEPKTIFGKLSSYPRRSLEYLLAHGLARPLAWPGSVKLLQKAMAPALLQGRMGLYEKGGLRAKLLTQDGNEIDTMFVDNRNDRESHNGNTLVICCEGNAAYYEVGSMGTPLAGNYSVLGWNHPGFMGSTGLPSPTSERNAIDAVVNYAVSRLAFDINDVILFAWSIGGYSATYAAMKYPDIKAIILDATFDNIKALAVMRMPPFASGLVTSVIEKYMDLDNIGQLKKYPGPIKIIRRQMEEIITTEPNVPATNRGNYLLKKLFVYRYPNFYCKESLEMLDEFLAADCQEVRDGLIADIGGINETEYEFKLALSPETFQRYPLDIGKEWSVEEKVKAMLYLASKHMDHFDATHCVALPANFFTLPWKHRVMSGNIIT